MKTISPIKKFSLIALALLIAFVCIVPLSVSAAGGGAPTNLYWDGYRAVWTEPGSGAPDNYVVKVYKNGTLSGTMTCFNTSLDVTVNANTAVFYKDTVLVFIVFKLNRCIAICQIDFDSFLGIIFIFGKRGNACVMQIVCPDRS